MFKRTPKFETLVQEMKNARLAYDRAVEEEKEAINIWAAARDAKDRANTAAYKAKDILYAADMAILTALKGE